MENSRRPFDRSRDPGPMKKPRLSDVNSNARQLTSQRTIGAASSSRFRAAGGRELESDPNGEAYQPQPVHPHYELVNQYKSALSELTINSKPIITNLTIIAGENVHAAKAVVATVCNNILEVPSDQKLPTLYLLDSIVKNIGRDYIKYFAAKLPEVFVKAYRQVDPPMRSNMRHLFGTWKGVFHPNTLQQIEKELGFNAKSDGSAAVSSTGRADLQSQRPPNSIHVNPKYLERQRLQQSGRAKGMVTDVPEIASNLARDSDRLERVSSIASGGSWAGPAKVNTIRRPQRDSLSEPLYERDMESISGEYDYTSELPHNSRPVIKKVNARVTDDGCEKQWYETVSRGPDLISDQRDVLHTKSRISNYATARLENLESSGPSRNTCVPYDSWKNSEEEEFMWDMHSRLSETDVATVNPKNELHTPEESERLESDNHLLKRPRLSALDPRFDPTSTNSYSSEQKDGSVYGRLSSTSNAARKGIQPQSKVSDRHSPLRDSTFKQNVTKQDSRRTHSLTQRDPRASRFPAKSQSVLRDDFVRPQLKKSNAIDLPDSFQGKKFDSKSAGLTIASEATGQRNMSDLLEAVMKSGEFPKMDVSPPEVDESFSAEDDEDEDLCRICRSPEEPGNPLRYPCLCRGSIKFVHQDCLRTWLNRRRGNNKCEVCGRSYSFVPVYSENAPERLPCDEFLLGVLSRAGRYLKLIVSWTVVILFNAFGNSLHPLGQQVVADSQRVLAYLWVGLLYSSVIACSILIVSIVRMDVGVGGLPGWFLADGDGLQGGVLHFLWKYLKILCDWYYLKLILFLLQRLRRRVILVPPLESLLDEFGVFRRLLFFFDDHVFAGLAISVYVSTLFILLPFSIGWVVLATIGGGSSYLSGNSPVILGYMMMLSICFAYFGILFILQQSSLSVIVRWLSLGFHFITVTLPCHLLAFLAMACKNILLIKDVFVLFFKFGALPWILGWFLGICTSPMFGTRSFQILEIWPHNPCIMVGFRLLSGLSCLIIAVSYMEHIQKIMHKRAYWYLLDVTDPGYKITKLNLRHVFFVFASHGLLLVILFRLPMKAITLISPSFFPLELWDTDGSRFIGAAYAIYFNLMHAGPKWLIKLTKPAIELLVHKWIVTICSWLQLRDLLLVVPRGEEDFHFTDDNPWLLLYSLAEGSMVTFYKSQNDEDDIKEQRHNRYRTRIAIMLMLAALSLFLVGTAFMVLPILVGRVFSYSISFILRRVGIKHDDVCAFWTGCYILRAIYVSICFAFDHIWTGRTDFLLKYILIRIRNALLFSIWIVIIPGLLGLLIDLMIIIPLRVPLNETPLYFLIQDWLVGVVVLHIWTFLTMLTPIKCLATKAWRRKFERIRSVGLNKLPSMWLLRDVIDSTISSLLTTLSIPCVLVKSLLPLLGYSQSFNAATERFIWPASLALIVVWFVTKLTLEIIIYLHQLIFNERYMVGERVGDLTEDL